jgi:hypothetical protein
MAQNMSFKAKYGSSCDVIPFNTKKFCQEHKQWMDYSKYLFNRPTKEWTAFTIRDANDEHTQSMQNDEDYEDEDNEYAIKINNDENEYDEELDADELEIEKTIPNITIEDQNKLQSLHSQQSQKQQSQNIPFEINAEQKPQSITSTITNMLGITKKEGTNEEKMPEVAENINEGKLPKVATTITNMLGITKKEGTKEEKPPEVAEKINGENENKNKKSIFSIFGGKDGSRHNIIHYPAKKNKTKRIKRH